MDKLSVARDALAEAWLTSSANGQWRAEHCPADEYVRYVRESKPFALDRAYQMADWALSVAALAQPAPSEVGQAKPFTSPDAAVPGQRYLVDCGGVLAIARLHGNRWLSDRGPIEVAPDSVISLKDVSAALTPAPDGEAVILKGVGKIDGDGWKDTTRKGEIVFVWNEEKPAPYAPGQFPRIGLEHWAASTDQYDFTPANPSDIPDILAALTPGPGGETDQPIAYAPKGHVERYLKGRNTACWVYGSPTADDNVPLYLHADRLTPSAALTPAPQPAEVKKLPRLTRAMIEAACKAHYGDDNIDGIDLTAKDRNYTFEQGFRRMWQGIAAAIRGGAE